jgi:prolyl-tRNA synthetase
MFTLMVKDLYSSYKDLPLSIYQIQTKYRDEARPRAGLLRGREFVMKDSYSFDIDDAGLQARVLRRPPRAPTCASSTGSASTTSSSGHVRRHGRLGLRGVPRGRRQRRGHVRACPGGYAANVEAVASLAPAQDASAVPRRTSRTPPTPHHRHAGRLSNARFPRGGPGLGGGRHPEERALHARAPDGSREPLAIGLPGDREVDTKRLEAAVEPARVDAFAEEDFASFPTLVKGYIGPGALGLAEDGTGVRYLLDPARRRRHRWITGANSPATTCSTWSRAATSPPTAPRRGRTARRRPGPRRLRSAEPGPRHRDGPHLPARPQVRRRAGAEGARRERQARHRHDGLLRRGCLAGGRRVAEETSDELGLIWPRNVAPFDVHIVVTGKDAAPLEFATALAESVSEAGFEVLLDDRKASPGVKFADAEVLGMPTTVVVGRGLADGVVEIRDRATREKAEVPADEAVERVLALLGR